MNKTFLNNQSMNVKQKLNKCFLLVGIFASLTLIRFSNSEASSLRILSLGNTNLITEDDENEINLYDYGLNPAWLINDWTENWLRISSINDVQRGSFRRQYDPEDVIDMHIIFEGRKLLENKQAFYGSINYVNIFKHGVDQSVNREPYPEYPFRLTDNTKGDMHYNGPKVSAQYCRNLYRDKLFIAGAVEYQIESGLKHAFMQPRTIYRYSEIGTALAYRISPALSVGATFNYSNSQEVIEYIPPTTFEYRITEVRLYKGELIFSPENIDMELFTKLKTFNLGFQNVYNISDNFKIGMKITGNFQDLQVIENRLAPLNEGFWKLKGYQLNITARDKINTIPLALAVSFDRTYYNDWAIHPKFKVLLSDDYFSGNYWGLGLAYNPGRLYVAAEIHRILSLVKKRDYTSQLIETGDIIDDEFKFGLEYSIFKNCFIRTGFVLTKNNPANTLLVFREFENKYKKYIFTNGVGLKFNFVETDFYIQYSQKSDINSTITGKRETACFYITFKVYK